MRTSTILLVAAIVLGAPIPAHAALQCVTYARDVTGLNLKGDAWKWWEAADGLYDRGKRPREGAVMVFKRQGSMRHGHVSVVRQMADSRVVLVDHANWAPHRSAGRGKVAQAVPVMDVSPANDWSQVRVWYRPTNSFGSKVYQTVGFVYRPNLRSPYGAHAGAASADAPAPHPVAAPAHVTDETPAPRAVEAALHAPRPSAPALPQAEVAPPKALAPAEAASAEAARPAALAPRIDPLAWAEQA